jgi:SAM-dependent methyltransferase
MAWAHEHHARLTQIAWAAADGQCLPFAEGQFDGAFTVTALCFAPDHGAIVRELRRVVRPGGRVVLGELNALAPWQLWRRVKALAPHSPYRQAHFHTVAGLRRLVREAGLSDVRHEVLLHWLPLAQRPLLSLAPLAERLGRRFLPGLGAFVVVSAVRPA